MNPEVRLSQMIARGEIPHALLFCGSKESKKIELAHRFALDLVGGLERKVDCHPDIHLFFPEGKLGLHPIGQLRNLIGEIALVPFEAPWKIFIIHEAERMLEPSSHILLKTLEEPPRQSLLILLSDHPEKMLPTIVSRCQRLDFFSQPQQSRHQILDVLAGNIPLDSIEEEADMEALLETIVLWYRDRLLLEIEGGETFFSFPEYLPHIKKSPLVPLEQMEELIWQTRLGLERSMKRSTVLEILFLQIKEVAC